MILRTINRFSHNELVEEGRMASFMHAWVKGSVLLSVFIISLIAGGAPSATESKSKKSKGAGWQGQAIARGTVLADLGWRAACARSLAAT